jgi:hypothetical protein
MHTLLVIQKPEKFPFLRSRLSRYLVLWLGACWSLPAAALQPLVTDDTDTQGRGGNQLEVAFERERVRSPGDRTNRYALPLVYTRGLTDTLDGYIEVSRLRIDSNAAGEDGRGSGNPAVGFKWRFWEDEARKVSFGFKPELQLGVSRASERHGLGNGRTGYAATFIVSKETSFGAIHANLSANRVGYDLAENREANRRTLYRFSVAPVVSLSPTWKAALDMGITTNPDRARRARMGYVELGTIWAPSEDLELALGLIKQVGDGEPSSHTVTAGITWRF